MNQPKTLLELTESVRKYVDTEEFLKSKNSNQVDVRSSRSKRKQDDPEKDTGKKSKRSPQIDGREQVPTTFTPLYQSI